MYSLHLSIWKRVRKLQFHYRFPRKHKDTNFFNNRRSDYENEHIDTHLYRAGAVSMWNSIAVRIVAKISGRFLQQPFQGGSPEGNSCHQSRYRQACKPDGKFQDFPEIRTG